MPAINWIVKSIRKLRKKYILDLTPEQEEAVKELVMQGVDKGIEIGKDIVIQSIS